MSRLYRFKIEIQGWGNTPEEGWNDACESFALESGPPPDEHEIIEEDEDD